MSSDPGCEIRQWLLTATTATLCTLAADEDVAGWPFGSLAPFALRADGTPIVLLSEIALHTRNLRRDPRVSLFVRDPNAGGDAQGSWRVTILARARALTSEGESFEEIHARYRERVPAATSYLETHDFRYFELEPVRVRAIGGFGAIGWLDPAAIGRDPLGAGLRESASAILSHMNADHEDALRQIVEAATGARPARARITSIDRAGFLVRTESPDELRYVGFGREIEAREAREVFVALLRAAQKA